MSFSSLLHRAKQNAENFGKKSAINIIISEGSLSIVATLGVELRDFYTVGGVGLWRNSRRLRMNFLSAIFSVGDRMCVVRQCRPLQWRTKLGEATPFRASLRV
jgi:hypothetical protein